MAKARIFPGPCEFVTLVEAEMDGRICRLSIESECDAIRTLPAELKEVDPYKEIPFLP